MRESRIETDGVPARLYEPVGAAGLLLLGHGGGQHKDAQRFVELCRRYAEGTGLAVVCIDAADHGERRPRDAVGGGGPPPGWHSRVAAEMVADWRRTADGLQRIGPPVAYVGFSMGAIFGAFTVAAMPAIQAAVFVVGGIPGGGGIVDPALGPTLLEAAAQLGGVDVAMINKTDDDTFPFDGVHAFFDAIPGDRKRLDFWPGGHDDWPAEAIDASVEFLRTSLSRDRRDP